MVLHEDYLMRIVERIRQLAERALKKSADEEHEQALEDLGELYRELPGVDRSLLEMVDAATACRLLNQPGLVLAVTDIMRAEGDVHRARGQSTAATAKYRRALNLLAEIASDDTVANEVLRRQTEIAGLIS